jgi:hypothetical protein
MKSAHCGDYLLYTQHQPASPTEWEHWLAATRAANRYHLTPDGIRIAVFYTKLHDRLLVPLTAADQPPSTTRNPAGPALAGPARPGGHRTGTSESGGLNLTQR